MARIASWMAVVLCVIGAVRVGADSSVDRSLGRQRTAAAAAAYALAEAHWRAGTEITDSVYRWSVRWLDSQRDAKGVVPPAAAQAHQQRMQALEAQVKARFAAGSASTLDTAAAEYYRLDADFMAGSR